MGNITIVHGVYKPTYNWGGHHLVGGYGAHGKSNFFKHRQRCHLSLGLALCIAWQRGPALIYSALVHNYYIFWQHGLPWLHRNTNRYIIYCLATSWQISLQLPFFQHGTTTLQCVFYCIIRKTSNQKFWKDFNRKDDITSSPPPQSETCSTWDPGLGGFRPFQVHVASVVGYRHRIITISSSSSLSSASSQVWLTHGAIINK